MTDQEIRDNIRNVVMDISSGKLTEASVNVKTNDLFSSLQHKGILSYLTVEDIIMIHALSTDASFAGGGISERLSLYDSILNKRGFIRSTAGTNRLLYTSTFDDTMVLKVALDKIGCEDNLGEFRNQTVLRPYVPKTFDVTKNGEIALSERVYPYKTREEFAKIGGSEVYDVIQYFYSHGFVMEDVGTNFFKNWGQRKNFGPVLLDYPYVYKLNKSRLICNKFIDGKRCGGKIDYDDGFNFLHCSKCGARYSSKDIGTPFKVVEEKKKRREANNTMNTYAKITIHKNGVTYSNANSVDVIDSKNRVDLVNQIDGVSAAHTPTVEEVMDKFHQDKEDEKFTKPSVNKISVKMSVVKPTKKVVGSASSTTKAFKREYDTTFRPVLVNYEWKKMMGELGSKYNFDPKDMSLEFREFIKSYLYDHMFEFVTIDAMVMDNDTFTMTEGEKKQFDHDIREEFNKNNRSGGYIAFANPNDLFIVSTGRPYIDKKGYLETYRKAVEEYFKKSSDEKDALKAVDTVLENVIPGPIAEKVEEPEKEVETPVKPKQEYTTLKNASPIAEATLKEDDAVDITATLDNF